MTLSNLDISKISGTNLSRDMKGNLLVTGEPLDLAEKIIENSKTILINIINQPNQPNQLNPYKELDKSLEVIY